MQAINLSIGTLPYFIVIYHILKLITNHKYHATILLELVGCFVSSKLLKIAFGVKRNKTVKKDWLHLVRKIINKFDSGHSFPSSHIMFYTTYYLQGISIWRVCFILFACYGRVYYEHHVVKDVVAGVFFGIVYNIIILLIKRFA